MKRFLWYHGPTIFWAALIFVLSSIPSLKPPELGISIEDKLGHMLEFGVFGYFLQRSFNYMYNNSLRVYLIVFFIGVAYGGLDEIHQSFVIGREATLGDFYADTAGIVLSQAIFRIKMKI